MRRRRRWAGSPFALTVLPRGIGPAALGTATSATLMSSGHWSFTVGSYGTVAPFMTVTAKSRVLVEEQALGSLAMEEAPPPSVDEQVAYLHRKLPGLYVPEELLRDLVGEAISGSSRSASQGCALASGSFGDGTIRLFAASGASRPVLSGYTLHRGDDGHAHTTTDFELPCWSPVRQVLVDAREGREPLLILRQPNRVAFMHALHPELDERLAMTTELSDAQALGDDVDDAMRIRSGMSSVLFDREISEVAISPFLGGELLVGSSTGALMRVAEQEGSYSIVDSRQMPDDVPVCSSDYSWHPRIGLCAAGNKIHLVDFRSSSSGNVQSAWDHGEEATSLRTVPSNRFNFVTASESSIRYFDARFARRPILEWQNSLPQTRGTCLSLPDEGIFNQSYGDVTEQCPVVTWSPSASDIIVHGIGPAGQGHAYSAPESSDHMQWRGPIYYARDTQRRCVRGVCVLDDLVLSLYHSGVIEAKSIERVSKQTGYPSTPFESESLQPTQLPASPGPADESDHDVVAVQPPLPPRQQSDLVPSRTIDLRHVASYIAQDFVDYGMCATANSDSEDDKDPCDCTLVDDTFFARAAPLHPLTLGEARALVDERCRFKDRHSALAAIQNAIADRKLGTFNVPRTLASPLPISDSVRKQQFWQAHKTDLEACRVVLTPPDAHERLRMTQSNDQTELQATLRRQWESTLAATQEGDETDSDLAATLSLTESLSRYGTPSATPTVRVSQRSRLLQQSFFNSQRFMMASQARESQYMISTPEMTPEMTASPAPYSQPPSVSSTPMSWRNTPSIPSFSPGPSASISTPTLSLSQPSRPLSLMMGAGSQPSTPVAAIKRKRGF